VGKETVKNGKWYPEFILKDLIDVGGLSAKSIGSDVKDLSGRRFFYDKKPFAIVGWKQDTYAMLAFPADFDSAIRELIVKAFIKVFEYKPFVQYEIFQNNENFIVFEWEKIDPNKKISEILATPGTKNIEEITEKY
jgi:hypothetical protein